eukprot:EG_transcript_7255
MTLTVGPVIGLVTHNCARILLEFSEAAVLTVLLSSPVGAHEVTRNVPARRAAVFAFYGLQPTTQWTVTVRGVAHPPSSFRTFPERVQLSDCLTFGVVSCNNLRITREMVPEAGCVWRATADYILERKIDVLLHIGDQVYGDDDWSNYEDGKLTYEQIAEHCTYAKAKQLLEATPQEHWPSLRPRITEMYRDCYREAWGEHAPTRLALANCPNLMIYDDHDMRDDLGDKPGEFDPTTDTWLIVDCGRRAAFEYQRQLYEDFDLAGDGSVPRVARENHFVHVLGDIGLLFVDSRGAKTFNTVPGDLKPFLTSAQWQDIHASLSPSGALAHCKVLFFLTQIPMVFFGQKLTEAIAKKADDFEGMWSYKRNRVEQMEMLEALWQWQAAAPERLVLLAGGDVHLGGFTRVSRNDEFAFEQLTVGPVSNQTIKAVELLVTNSAKDLGKELGDGWTYDHEPFINKRNIGLVRIGPTPYTVHWAHLIGTDHVEEVPVALRSKRERIQEHVHQVTSKVKDLFHRR